MLDDADDEEGLPVILPLNHTRFPLVAPRSFAGERIDASAESACQVLPEPYVENPLRPLDELVRDLIEEAPQRTAAPEGASSSGSAH